MTLTQKTTKLYILNLIFFIILGNSLGMSIAHGAGLSRIKDIVRFEGIRDNILVGYGLVVGLNGTGDNLNNSSFTKQGLTDFLNRMGVNIKGSNLKTKNIAAVTITATLPAFARHGNKIDVNISTIGDAKSLEGGTLLATPILGADGEVYAVAQGPITISSFRPTGVVNKTENLSVLTNGTITSGAVVEKEIDFRLNDLEEIKIALLNSDISTAVNIATVINERMEGDWSTAIDPSTVVLKVPSMYQENVVGLLSLIENIEILPDTPAKIIIEQASGTVVIGENIHISPVAVSQGNLSIVIDGGATKDSAKVSAIADDLKPRGKEVAILESGATLKDLVDALNQLGVMPRDLIAILYNIKVAGALQAEIEVR